MKTIAVLATALAFLTGCTAVSNYAEDLKHTSALRYFVSDEEKQERYRNICKEIGVQPDTEMWERCLIQAYETDRRRGAERAARANAKARECGMTGKCS